MSMVEGIGDEVIQVLGICFVVLIFAIAWKSTAIRELPQIRAAVFIVDRRSQSVYSNDAGSVQAPAAPPDPGPSTPLDSTADPPAETTTRAAENATGSHDAAKPSTSNEINALRLSYFSSLQTPAPSTSASPSTSSSTSASNEQEETAAAADSGEAETAENSIRVKLKYLNDDQRIVRGNLKELLGQFKRRYFQMELSNNKHVLLIFQGRVLREEETLETIGMYDNCVVHCLVKNGRAPDAEGRAAAGSHPSSSAPADWNLGPLLLAILVAMFAMVWYSYWTYPHLFGITSTILLTCLTVIFILAVASFHYPQLFQSL